MKRILAASIFMMLMMTYAAAQVAPTCIRFEACVDGSDWVTVDGGQLTMAHGAYSPIGSHGNCEPAWRDIIKIDGVSHSVSYSGGYLIDGQGSLPVSIEELESYSKIGGRGGVTQTDKTIYIDDNSYGGGALYTVDLCGEPEEVSVPEFTTLGVAAVILLTAPGFAYLIARKRK